jgi:hypothetical protein
MRLDTQWHGLERLTYYVLFPMLLIQTLVKADLTKVPVGGVGGALFLSALAMSLLCLALRPALQRLDIDGPAFTSIFQGATRWQTYVALSVSANLYGDVGLALGPRDRGDLLGGADLAERLCAGPADGRRRATARADHHPADDPGCDHHARCYRSRCNRDLRVRSYREEEEDVDG